MKTKALISLIVTLISIQCYSQNSNEFRIYYGFVDSKLLRNADLDGSGSYENENSYEFGFKYLRKISGKLFLETGINYMSTQVKITSAPTGLLLNSHTEDLKMISIPIYANYTFGNYFFINGGPILDFQNSQKSFDSQSGIGYSIGVGGKYDFDKFSIFVNPNYKRHSLIPFEKESNHQKLTEFGIQVGLRYGF
jgi:predicted porin